MALKEKWASEVLMGSRALRVSQVPQEIEARGEELEKLDLKVIRALKGQEASQVFQGQKETAVCQAWMAVRVFLAFQVLRAMLGNRALQEKLAFKVFLVCQEAQGQKVHQEKRVMLEIQDFWALWDLRADRVSVENKESLDPSGLLA